MGRIVSTSTVTLTPFQNRCFYNTTTTFTLPSTTPFCSGLVRVTVVGSGANGAYCMGGASGGYAQKVFSAASGCSYCVCIVDYGVNKFANCVCATSACLASTPGCGVGGDNNYVGALGICCYTCVTSALSDQTQHCSYYYGHTIDGYHGAHHLFVVYSSNRFASRHFCAVSTTGAGAPGINGLNSSNADQGGRGGAYGGTQFFSGYNFLSSSNVPHCNNGCSSVSLSCTAIGTICAPCWCTSRHLTSSTIICNILPIPIVQPCIFCSMIYTIPTYQVCPVGYNAISVISCPDSTSPFPYSGYAASSFVRAIPTGCCYFNFFGSPGAAAVFANYCSVNHTSGPCSGVTSYYSRCGDNLTCYSGSTFNAGCFGSGGGYWSFMVTCGCCYVNCNNSHQTSHTLGASCTTCITPGGTGYVYIEY